MIAAVVSHRQMHELALRQGESELGAALMPLALAVSGVILTVVGILGIFPLAFRSSAQVCWPWPLLRIRSKIDVDALSHTQTTICEQSDRFRSRR